MTVYDIDLLILSIVGNLVFKLGLIYAGMTYRYHKLAESRL